MRSVLLVGLLGWACAACGDDTTGAGGGGTGGAGGTGATTSGTSTASTGTGTGTGGGGTGGGAADVVVFDVETRVEAGTEVQLCKYVTMPTDRGEVMAVQRASHTYSDGSHHFLVYRTAIEAMPEGGDELRPCDESAWMSEVRGVAYAAQAPEGELALPEGVAQRFAPGEVLLVQTHYVNPGAEALDASIHLELELVDPEAAPVEAGVFFFFNPIIHVPPRASARSTLSCPVPEDVDLVFATSHMHARGTGFTAQLEGQPEGSIYATDEWEEPLPRQFAPGDPAARVPAGSSIQYSCDFDNPSDDLFRAGPSATDDEMCMFVGMYYPRLETGDELCWEGRAATAGTTSCLDTIACASACEGDDACVAACLDQVCPNGAIPLMRLTQCSGPACGAECGGGDADACQACVIANCAEEALACQAATCAAE